MGRGISGVIPVAFHFQESWRGNLKDNFIKHSPADIFDFYDEIEENGKVVAYRIKSQMLLRNFKDFYIGFHTIIDAQDVLKNCIKFDEKYDAIIKRNDMDAFLDHFSENTAYDPYYMTESECFSALDIECDEFLIVYNGSYKAFLEEYQTFYHIERLLVKAFDNPLAKVTKFGLFG
jgi:hypothetical protein